MAETLELLLKPDAAAKALAISASKLWQLTNCGDVRCVRIGRAVRYDPADLRAWIDQIRFASSAPRR
jgi:predicted DNA-binding transcriptional regulator AlpA